MLLGVKGASVVSPDGEKPRNGLFFGFGSSGGKRIGWVPFGLLGY